MRVVNHNEKCAGLPAVGGKLRAKCNCKEAKRTEAAYSMIDLLISQFGDHARKDKEDPKFTAMRFENMADLLTSAAHSVRMHAPKKKARRA